MTQSDPSRWGRATRKIVCTIMRGFENSFSINNFHKIHKIHPSNYYIPKMVGYQMGNRILLNRGVDLKRVGGIHDPGGAGIIAPQTISMF